jgi:uracil phosphoribosyltransferase
MVLVPILRAGIGMTDAIIKLIPNAKVGHIGLYRDPNTFQPIEYFCKLPKCEGDMELFVLEPMLATGGSASAAIQFIKERGFKNIKYICLVAAPDGVKRLQVDHPDVDIYAAAFDRVLNEQGFIVPGLGDVGDRIFGTK